MGEAKTREGSGVMVVGLLAFAAKERIKSSSNTTAKPNPLAPHSLWAQLISHLYT